MKDVVIDKRYIQKFLIDRNKLGRQENETFEEYKFRLKLERSMQKDKLKGKLYWNSSDKNLGSIRKDVEGRVINKE